MMCYFLYWLIQFPFMFVSPQKIRWLFVAKGILVPIAWLAMLIWAFVKVPSHGSLFHQSAAVSGSKLSWAWLSALNSALGIYSTLAVNIPDFTVCIRLHSSNFITYSYLCFPGRGMRRTNDSEPALFLKQLFHLIHVRQYIQIFIIPIAFTFVGFIGIAVTSAGASLYNGIFWDPLRLIDNWDNRAAAFFASFSFFLATLGTNISANSLCAGNDMTALCPRVRRVMFFSAMLTLLTSFAVDKY